MLTYSEDNTSWQVGHQASAPNAMEKIPLVKPENMQ
jgi:hypothetical protein